MTPSDLDTELFHILNIEIALELLRENCPDISEEEAKEIANLCGANAGNAVPLYHLRKLMESESKSEQ